MHWQTGAAERDDKRFIKAGGAARLLYADAGAWCMERVFNNKRALFGVLLAHQRDAGIRGDLLKIGVYRGKSAILLGYALRPDEELVACDLFEAAVVHEDTPLHARYRACAPSSSWPPGTATTTAAGRSATV